MAIDITRAVNDEDLYGTLAHELLGHAHMALADHPLAIGSDECRKEQQAYTVAVSLEKEVIKRTREGKADHNLKQLEAEMASQEEGTKPCR